MTTWSVGEVVNTLGSHPSIQGFEPPTDYHFFMRIKKKESRAFFLKMFVRLEKNYIFEYTKKLLHFHA